MAFSAAWLDELLSKSEISDIISAYVDLKPKGRKLWGLCPFHGEKTPSFSVSPDKQLFYCFGCHVGGSVIQFVMQIEKLSYSEAIHFLADRAHMALPDRVTDEDYLKNKAYKERLIKINQAAARFFCEQLIGENGEEARKYAGNRGLSKEIILRFGIGYAPDSWDKLKKHLLSLGFTEKEMIDAGVLIRNAEKNSSYDTYRNRLIFPIQSVNGSVIGFGGRVLDNSKPKYINTGDTPVYNKKNNLYGLNLLKQEKLNDIIIVEGYMDVVGLYKAGVHNVVASLGTALTVQQAKLLKRYCSEIYIAYDGDFAGQSGMMRGLDILAEQGLSVHIIIFPDNLDPDEYVQKYGRENFFMLKSDALTISGFKLEHLSNGIDFSLEDQREKYAIAACKYISSLDPIVQERYLKVVEDKTGYSIQSLLKQIATASGKNGNPSASLQKRFSIKTVDNTNAEDKNQCMILAAFIQDESVHSLIDACPADSVFSDPDYFAFYQALLKNKQSVATYIAGQSNETAHKLSTVLQTDYSYSNPAQVVKDCIENIRANSIDSEIAALQTQLINLNGENETEIIKKIMDLQKLKRGGKQNGENRR